MDPQRARFGKVGEYVARSVAGETIVVPIRSNVGDLDSIYTFNEVGALIWSLIDGSRTVDEIAGAVVDEFDVDLDEARRDVVQFVSTLSEAGLVRASADGRG